MLMPASNQDTLLSCSLPWGKSTASARLDRVSEGCRQWRTGAEHYGKGMLTLDVVAVVERGLKAGSRDGPYLEQLRPGLPGLQVGKEDGRSWSSQLWGRRVLTSIVAPFLALTSPGVN